MYARLSKSLLHARIKPYNWKNYPGLPRMMFTTQKDHIHLKETARIASQVIKMIRSPFEVSELEKEAWSHESEEQQIQRVNSYALAERIKDALMKIKTQEQSRDDVLQLFTTGVQPPDSIFHQQRIRNAKVYSKLVYCPNSIISRQIFQIMAPKNLQQPVIDRNRFVLKGFKGISKTVSVSLLWHLVRLIDDYRFSQKGIQENAKEKFNQPKIVYWSITQQDTLENVLQSLLQQLPELKRSFTIEEIIQKKVNIGRFYKDKFGIEVHLTVDQINLLAKWLRILLSIQQKGQKLSFNEKQSLKNVQELMRVVGRISAKFQRTIYLSSMDIEKEFLRRCDLATDGNHTIVKVYEVQYAQKIYKNASLTEISHFFIFQFNQKVFKKNNINVPKEELMKAQKMCAKYLQQRLAEKQYFFTTFFNIFQGIQNITNANLSQVTDFKLYLFEKFTVFIEKTTELVKNQFSAHFLKNDQNDQNRQILALRLSGEIDQIIKQENSKSSQLKKGYTIPLQKLKLKQGYVHEILPLSFFSYANDHVTLRIPAKLALQILEPKIAEWLDFYLEERRQWMYESSTASSLATNIQRLFVVALKKGGTSFAMSYSKILHSKFGASFAMRFEKNFRKIKAGSYPFIPLNKNGPHSLLQSLRNSLQKMINSNQKYAVIEPVIGKITQQDFINVKPYRLHETSKAIDLILARITQENKILLNVIDVTVSKQKKVVENKMRSFLDIILELKDQNQTFFEYKLNSMQKFVVPVELSYFIFCQKNKEKKLLKKLSMDPIYSKIFKFTGSSQVNCFGVQFLDNSSSLLVEVGFINIEEDILFLEESKDKKALSFRHALQVLNEKRIAQKNALKLSEGQMNDSELAQREDELTEEEEQ